MAKGLELELESLVVSLSIGVEVMAIEVEVQLVPMECGAKANESERIESVMRLTSERMLFITDCTTVSYRFYCIYRCLLLVACCLLNISLSVFSLLFVRGARR